MDALFQPESPQDAKPLMLHLHVLVTFTSTSSWRVLKDKSCEWLPEKMRAQSLQEFVIGKTMARARDDYLLCILISEHIMRGFNKKQLLMKVWMFSLTF